MHALAAQLDDIGKPAWIGLTLASFILFWPLGLVLLGYLIGSGRMACRTNGSGDRWQRRMDRMQRRMERMQAATERWGGGGYRASSGNRALTNTAPKRCAASKRSNANSSSFLTACATPGTKPNSTSSWLIVAVARMARSRRASDESGQGRLPPTDRFLVGSAGSRVAAAAITTEQCRRPSPRR
jgi:hypothetical protein